MSNQTSNKFRNIFYNAAAALTEHRIPRTLLQSPGCSAMLSGGIFGLLVHLFGIVMPIHNYDDIYIQPTGYGSGTSSGRWFLQILGDAAEKYFGGYNIHYLCGLFFILFAAISAGIMVSALEIKSRRTAALIGAIFISFPTAASTLLFTYTAPYYGIGILLAVLAVWIVPKHKIVGPLISAVCVAFSLGIYQAYLPLTAALFVLALIRQSLDDKAGIWIIVRRGIVGCAAMAAGLALYFVCSSISLREHHTVLGTYQGINEMGKLSLSEIPGLIWKSFSSFIMLPADDYCRLAQTKLLKLSYALLGVLTVLIILYIIIRKKMKPMAVILTAILCVLFPIAVNLIVIMCPDSYIYTLMVYAFAVVPCVPLALLEIIPEEDGVLKVVRTGVSRAAALVIAVLILCNSIMTNVNYVSLYYANRQVENFLGGLVIQVRMTEDFDSEKKWAFIGEIDDPLMYSGWQDTPYYSGNANAQRLLNSYSRDKFISTYIGYSPEMASDEDIQAIMATEEFQNMPCWPDEGSIQVIDEYVVVKFDNEP